MDLNIESIIEKQVVMEISGHNIEEIVKNEIRKIIASGVGKEIIASVNSVAKHMIAEEVRKALDGEVKTDDGWGKRESYPSFEELFRKTFKREMESKYEVKKEIEQQVSVRVKSLVQQDYNKVIEKIVDEISKTRLVKKDDPK